MLILVILSLTWACKDQAPESPGDEAPTAEPAPPAPEPEPEPEPDEDVPSTPPAPLPLASDAARLRVTPEILDVLQPNTVRLGVTLPGDRPRAACRWILSGGADEAMEGCTVEVPVPEVSSDIGWTLVITEEQTEIYRKEGRIPLERLWVEDGESGPEAPPTEGTKIIEGGEDSEEIGWTMTPGVLEVLQDTEVVLDADAPADATCAWDIGDGAPPHPGCRVIGLFREAHRDRTVTLTVRRNEAVVYSGARVLPLERLAVTRRTPEPEGNLPACSDGCRRLAVAAVQGAGLDRAYSLATGTGAAALVLFLHEPLPAPTAVEDLARFLGARNIGLLPVACGEGLGRDALATLLTNHALAAGLVLHSDATDLPARYAAQWGPAFLVALPTRADIPDEKWLTEQLDTAAMFRTRILLTCRAFDRLTGETPPLLPSPYRQYEKMRRGGLQLFVSGAHEAFYPGTYGNLRTLSPGRLQGPSAPLLGQDAPQGPVAALIDIDESRIRRIIGVVPSGEGWAPFPEENLPEKVGVYRIWK
ncbi:MAG: hypothetical protein ABIK09_13795 [Pseudomonadota bacterium]